MDLYFECNSFDEFKTHIENGADVNQTSTPEGRNLLIWAILTRRFTLAEYLITKTNINVTYETSDGETALGMTCFADYGFGGCADLREADDRIVQLLLDHPEIDPNVRDRDGKTLLQKTIKNGSLRIFRILVKHSRVDVNLQDENGETIQMHLIKKKMTRFAISLGKSPNLDPNLRDKKGETALMRAGHDDILLALMHPAADPNLLDANGETCLYRWCSRLKDLPENETVEAIKSLLAWKERIDIHLTSSEGIYPVYYVFKCKNHELMKWFLNHPDFDPNKKYIFNYEDTLLHYVIENRDYRSLELLFEHSGTDVNFKNKHGQTPLEVLGSQRSPDPEWQKVFEMVKTDSRLQ